MAVTDLPGCFSCSQLPQCVPDRFTLRHAEDVTTVEVELHLDPQQIFVLLCFQCSLGGARGGSAYDRLVKGFGAPLP